MVVDESLERLLRGVAVDGDDRKEPPQQDGNDEGHHRCYYAREEEEDVREGDGDRNKDGAVTGDIWDGVEVVVDKDIARDGVDNDEEDNHGADGNDAVEEDEEDDVGEEGDDEVEGDEDGDNNTDTGVVVAEILRAVSFPCAFLELWI